MTQTAKIKEILEAKEWQWKYWPMFNFNMKMDNWEYIHLNKKSKDAFKVWDEVTYRVVEPWKKWEEVKQNAFKPKAQDQRGYFTSIAFQIAFQSYSWEESYKYCSDLARRIFADMMDNYENKQPEEENGNTGQNTESPKADKRNDDDLPF